MMSMIDRTIEPLCVQCILLLFSFKVIVKRRRRLYGHSQHTALRRLTARRGTRRSKTLHDDLSARVGIPAA